MTDGYGYARVCKSPRTARIFLPGRAGSARVARAPWGGSIGAGVFVCDEAIACRSSTRTVVPRDQADKSARRRSVHGTDDVVTSPSTPRAGQQLTPDGERLAQGDPSCLVSRHLGDSHGDLYVVGLARGASPAHRQTRARGEHDGERRYQHRSLGDRRSRSAAHLELLRGSASRSPGEATGQAGHGDDPHRHAQKINVHGPRRRGTGLPGPGGHRRRRRLVSNGTGVDETLSLLQKFGIKPEAGGLTAPVRARHVYQRSLPGPDDKVGGVHRLLFSRHEKSRITARSGASGRTACPHLGKRSKRTRCAGSAAAISA